MVNYCLDKIVPIPQSPRPLQANKTIKTQIDLEQIYKKSFRFGMTP